MILYYNVIFYPSQMLLHKICKLLWAMTAAELAPLKKALCFMDKPHSQSQSPQVREHYNIFLYDRFMRFVY